MRFVFDDGGRSAAGFKGNARDCFTRAIAIATGIPYAEVYDAINEVASTERTSKRRRGKSSARTGVHHVTARRFMEKLGWKWTACMGIGTGCKIHMRADELPRGRIIVTLSRHYAAIIDGVCHDNHDSTKDGTRCVYGYWSAS